MSEDLVHAHGTERSLTLGRRLRAGLPSGTQLRKLFHVFRNPLYRAGLRAGVAASIEHEAVPFSISPATILDVGANRGQFALFAMHRFPRARLLCFEPLAGPRARLEQVLAVHPEARIFGVALDATTGKRVMHVARRDDSSSLLRTSSRQLSVFPGTDEVGNAIVSAVRLDELVGRGDLVQPVLLKIDVQGSELAVLRGAGALLHCVSELIVECSFEELYAAQPLADEVIGYLRRWGFRLTSVAGVTRDVTGRAVQADLLFAR